MRSPACSRRAPGMRSAVFLTLARPAPKLAPPRCSRACCAVKREAGRALRMEIANLRCPRNGKWPRRTTQAGSGAFRVQVARGARATARDTRGKASRYAASPDTGRGEEPARLHDARPAGKRGAPCSTGFVFDADPNRPYGLRRAPRCAAPRHRAYCDGGRFARAGGDARGRGARTCRAVRRVAVAAGSRGRRADRAPPRRARGADRPDAAPSTILRRRSAACGGGSTERGRVTPAPTLGRAPACATRSATRSNPAVHCERCRTRPWHPRRARGGINQPRFVRAHIHNLFDEEDKLAYA